MTIGENVKKIREKKELRRNDLVRKIVKTNDRDTVKIMNTYLTRIEKNEIKNPGIYNLKKIANALDVKIDDLLQ